MQSDHGSKSKAFEEALDYFKYKRGLTNDFTFPADLLNDLKPRERSDIEKKIITRSLEGDSRFYKALGNVCCYDLRHCFTAEKMSKITGYKRIKLLEILYISTYEPDYLRNIIYMMPAESSAAQIIGKLLDNDDWWESGILDSPEFRSLLVFLNMIRTTRGKAEKATRIFSMVSKADRERKHLLLSILKDLPEPDREQLGIMTDIGNWKFDGWEEFGLYWETLSLRMDYAETRDFRILCRIVRNSLTHSYVYDILNYMHKNGEVEETELLRCTLSA